MNNKNAGIESLPLGKTLVGTHHHLVMTSTFKVEGSYCFWLVCPSMCPTL